MTFMSASDQDDIAPRRLISERTTREMMARAETAISLIGRHVRGHEQDDRGVCFLFMTRDAALCAKTLLEAHEVCEHVTVFAQAGKWRSAGAWRVREARS